MRPPVLRELRRLLLDSHLVIVVCLASARPMTLPEPITRLNRLVPDASALSRLRRLSLAAQRTTCPRAQGHMRCEACGESDLSAEMSLVYSRRGI